MNSNTNLLVKPNNQIKLINNGKTKILKNEYVFKGSNTLSGLKSNNINLKTAIIELNKYIKESLK